MKIKVNSRRFGIIVTPFSRQSGWSHDNAETSAINFNFRLLMFQEIIIDQLINNNNNNNNNKL